MSAILRVVGRRLVLASVLAGPAGLARRALAGAGTVRIGVQKYGTLVILRDTAALEPVLGKLGYTVEWTEFPGGPQLLEALNVGELDFGIAGEAPPIFALAAGAPLVYVGVEPPSPTGEAILVPAQSPLRAVADLRGKRVALNKGSNVHYLLVRALQSAHLTPQDIEAVYLTPADARAAFEQGSVDAWAIWDPFLAAAQPATGARVLVDARGLANNRQYFLASRDFANQHPDVVGTIMRQVAATDRWAAAHLDSVEAMMAPKLGLPADVTRTALRRMSYGAGPMTMDAAADQQRIADTFFELRLIPVRVDVHSALWTGKA